MKKPAIIAIALLILVAFVAFLAFKRPSELQVTAAFIGWTNNSIGGRVITVAVTNSSQVKIWLTGGSQTEHKVVPASNMWFIQSATLLVPGQVEILRRPAPTNLGAIRVLVDVAPAGWRYQVSGWMRDDSARFIPYFIRRPLIAFPMQQFQTEWIEP